MQCRFIGLVILLILFGCEARQKTDLALDYFQNPDQLTLYSIDGRDDESSGDDRRGEGVPKAVGEFHGYPMLGKVEITDSELRKQLVAALKDGIARRGPPATCFWPRHGIRIVEKGKTVEYVICFQCHIINEYFGDNKRRGEGINPDVRAMFDTPLKEAGIAIAPGQGDKANKADSSP